MDSSKKLHLECLELRKKYESNTNESERLIKECMGVLYEIARITVKLLHDSSYINGNPVLRSIGTKNLDELSVEIAKLLVPKMVCINVLQLEQMLKYLPNKKDWENYEGHPSQLLSEAKVHLTRQQDKNKDYTFRKPKRSFIGMIEEANTKVAEVTAVAANELSKIKKAVATKKPAEEIIKEIASSEKNIKKISTNGVKIDFINSSNLDDKDEIENLNKVLKERDDEIASLKKELKKIVKQKDHQINELSAMVDSRNAIIASLRKKLKNLSVSN